MATKCTKRSCDRKPKDSSGYCTIHKPKPADRFSDDESERKLAKETWSQWIDG